LPISFCKSTESGESVEVFEKEKGFQVAQILPLKLKLYETTITFTLAASPGDDGYVVKANSIDGSMSAHSLPCCTGCLHHTSANDQFNYCELMSSKIRDYEYYKNTNNQEIYTIFRLLEKSHEEKPKLTVQNGYNVEKKNYRSQWLKTYKWESLKIEYEPCQVALLLKYLNKYRHFEGNEWDYIKNKEGKIVSVVFKDSPLLTQQSEEDSL